MTQPCILQSSPWIQEPAPGARAHGGSGGRWVAQGPASAVPREHCHVCRHVGLPTRQRATGVFRMWRKSPSTRKMINRWTSQKFKFCFYLSTIYGFEVSTYVQLEADNDKKCILVKTHFGKVLMLFMKKGTWLHMLCFLEFWKNSVLGHVLAAQRDNWVKNVLQPTMIN